MLTHMSNYRAVTSAIPISEIFLTHLTPKTKLPQNHTVPTIFIPRHSPSVKFIQCIVSFFGLALVTQVKGTCHLYPSVELRGSLGSVTFSSHTRNRAWLAVTSPSSKPTLMSGNPAWRVHVSMIPCEIKDDCNNDTNI